MKLKVVLPLGALASALLAFGSASAATSAPGSAALAARSAAVSVKVVMKDQSLALAPRTVAAGKVTFVVRNAGKAAASFVVIKTNRAPNALPLKGTRASEAGKQAKIATIARGATKRLTVILATGKYVLIGNMPGQYKRGQFAGLVATGGSTATAPQTTEVSVSAFEMGFKLSQTKVPHGTVIFTVKNDGKVAHDFSFGSRGGGTPLLQPGESAKLTVTFTKPGKYTFICTVPGHLEAGMTGVLTVV